MASFRRIKIEDNVIKRDDSVTEEVWFDENTLEGVTDIGDWCFGLHQRDEFYHISERGIDSCRSHHASNGPSLLDLSLLVNCTNIGAVFALGHYGPVILPPALESVGDYFLMGIKCRVLELPGSLQSVGPGSFAHATADCIIFSNRMAEFGHSCFEGAHISTLKIPGSVREIGRIFCRGATIGTLIFAKSNADEHVNLSVCSFLENATVQTLDLKRSVRLVDSDGSSVIGASATISLLRRVLPTQLSSDVRADLLANLRGTPHEKATPTDPEVSRAAPQPPLDAVDLAELEVFEDKYTSLVQHGDTIDMRSLAKCLTLGPKCFAGLTGVSTLLLPPNLSVIDKNFMEDAKVPQLDLLFPQSVRDVGDMFLHKATVRSVSFAACDGLTMLGLCLIEATIANFTFPPYIRKIQKQFMQSVNAPHLKVEFPNTVETFEGSILHRAKLRSVDFSNLGERGCAEGEFLESATVEEIVFPQDLRELSRDFLVKANSPQLDLVFPASLQQVPWLSEATVRSVDCGECREVQMIVGLHLQQAALESYVFPPNVTTIGSWFMAGVQAPKMDLVFPSSVSNVESDVLKNATVRSVDFSKCAALQLIGQDCLRKATVASVLLPPNLRVLERYALDGICGEDLAIKFPESLKGIERGVLMDSTVKSIDMSAAKSVSVIPSCFCRNATVSDTVTLPPVVSWLEDNAFYGFTCARFRFNASPSLQLIEADVFCGANISTATITDSPKLKSVGDNFLSGATLETPASLVLTDRMTSVGKSFCAGTTLQRLDMHQCDKITTLPDKFLFETDCSRPGNGAEDTGEGCVRLPPNVVTFGDGCFESSKRITRIPANQSALTVGNSFGADSDIDKIPWAGYWVTVGHGFCKNVKALEIADAACFSSVGGDFCRGVGKLTVDFSQITIETLGAGFLQETTFSPETTSVDLSRCSFAECPERFMYQARFVRVDGKVVLPSTVSSVGAKCCAEVTQLEELSIASSSASASQPLVIQDNLLRGCASLKSVTLPSTVTSFGDRCLQGCPALVVSLSLPLVNRIGHDFCAGNQSTMVGGAAPGGSNDLGMHHEDSSTSAATMPRTKVSLENVCPHVQIGDNFLAHANCTSLAFGTIDCVAVEKDKLVVDLEAALLTRSANGTSNGALVLKELIARRKVTVTKLLSASPAFRSVTDELSVIKAQKHLPDRTERIAALLNELTVEEDLFFRDPTHRYEWAREALERGDDGGLLKVLKEMDGVADAECQRGSSNAEQQAVIATALQPSGLTIGHNFLSGTIGLTELDMSHALHTAIGHRFAANSALKEVHLPPSVTVIGPGVCDGCLATVAAAPQSGCYLSSWMKIPIEKERIDTLVHFREVLPASEQCGMARWLLEQKRFAEFKGVFNIRDDAANLRSVGGTVDDLPDVPTDVSAWLGFDMKVSPHDDGLSLLHWAVKYSRQFANLLSEVSWGLRDLTLMTEQGFTALHYAVLYDIEAAALGTLLSIAAKAEIHRTWSDAWGAGGVRVSPLHLAYLYRRDGIVKELLAFDWDPTEAIKPVGGLDHEGTLFDAFDQSIMELGRARAAAASQNTDHDSCSSRASVPVQLFHASILLCVCDALRTGIHPGHSTDRGIQLAFVTLRCRLTSDFPLVSPNKWAEARIQQRALAAWGSGEPNADQRSFNTQKEFLQAAFASALSDSAHGPNVRLRYRQLLSTTTSLKAFAMSQVGNLPDVPTHEFVAEMSTRIRLRFHRICRSKLSSMAPEIAADTLLLRTRSMDGGPHRDKVEKKLATVIPFRFVIPVLPFFYLTLMIVFGLSWFFHPPILAPTLMGIENAIADCTNPYNTKDATEDGVIPWNCSVGFTELGMQVETFEQTEAPQMASFFSFIEKDKIPRNVTHLPWAYLRFATIVTYNGLKTKVGSVADAVKKPENTAQKYWVLTELRKPPEWVPEIFEQKNTKANESTISFKGETTRTFAHTVVPYQFGNHTLLGAWMAGVAALLLACIVAFVYHGYAFWKIIAEREVRLVEVTTVQRSLRSILLACELAAVLFIGAGFAIMAATFGQHKADDLISRSTAAQWQRSEIFFRVGLTFCSFRAVSFFSEMPKPQHFAMVNAGAVGVALMAVLVSLLLLPASRVSVVASLKSLLSIQAVDVLTLPVVLAVSLFLRSSKVTDEVRQAHYDNLREDTGEDEVDGIGGSTPGFGHPHDASSAASPHVPVRGPAPPPVAEGAAGLDAGDGADVGHNATVGEQQAADPVRVEAVQGLLNPLSAPSAISGSTTNRSPVVGSVAQRSQPHTAVTIADEPVLPTPLTPTAGTVTDPAGARSRAKDPDSRESSNTPDHSGEEATNAAAVPDDDTRPALSTTDEQSKLTKKDRAATVRSRARRRWALSWAVILVAGLGQVLLYGLAVTVVVRPLLTLPAPGGVLPVTGDSFLSSDDLGMVGFARRFFF